MEKNSLEIIKQWCENYCNENGLFLVKVEQNGAKIEIFADSIIENITIQQCGQLSRFIQNKLEEETDLLSLYTLDVSSPGMTNPLLIPQQYNKRLNKNLNIQTNDGQNIEGKVINVTLEGIELEVLKPANKKKKEEEEIIRYQFNYNQIKKALIPLPTNFKKK